MRAASFILSASLLSACWTGRSRDPQLEANDAPPGQRGPLKVDFRVEPSSFSTAALGRVVTAFVVTNTTAQALDPKLDKADLMINGTRSIMWFNTNGNGGREPEWYKLPPGGSVHREYTIAGTLFDGPGEYTCVLKVSGISSPPVHVHVSP